MTDSTAPVFLIGYRGTGKSVVARLLAAQLGRECVDSDDEIERRAGRSIADIFARQGEPTFRDLEAEVVADLCQRQRIVIALGGGAVLREENRAKVRAADGPIVWLTAGIDTIAARLAGDTSTAGRRPDLTNTGGRAEIEALLAVRTPIYQACATLVVDTEGKTPANVADEILDTLGRGRGLPGS